MLVYLRLIDSRTTGLSCHDFLEFTRLIFLNVIFLNIKIFKTLKNYK